MSEKDPNQPMESLMMIAVIQAQDSEPAQNALSKLGFTVTRLPSVGGFLGRRNATLTIGLPTERREEVIHSLNETCQTTRGIYCSTIGKCSFALTCSHADHDWRGDHFLHGS